MLESDCPPRYFGPLLHPSLQCRPSGTRIRGSGAWVRPTWVDELHRRGRPPTAAADDPENTHHRWSLRRMRMGIEGSICSAARVSRQRKARRAASAPAPRGPGWLCADRRSPIVTARVSTAYASFRSPGTEQRRATDLATARTDEEGGTDELRGWAKLPNVLIHNMLAGERSFVGQRSTTRLLFLIERGTSAATRVRFDGADGRQDLVHR